MQLLLFSHCNVLAIYVCTPVCRPCCHGHAHVSLPVTCFHSYLSSLLLRTEVRLYLIVLELVGKTEKRLEVVSGEIG